MFDRFQLDLTHPWWLASLVVVVPLLAWYFKRSLSDFPPKQILVSLLTRCVVVALLALAMSGLALLRPTSQQFVIVAIDQSLSVAGDEEDIPVATGDAAKEPVAAKKSQVDEYLDKALADAGRVGENKVMFLPFASQAGVLGSERPMALLNQSNGTNETDAKHGTDGVEAGAFSGSRLSSLNSRLDRNATDIAAAIRSAAGAMPPDYVPRIVLLSDGNQTAGDALQAALGTAFGSAVFSTANRSGEPGAVRPRVDERRTRGLTAPGSPGQLIPIDTVPLKVRDTPEVQVAAVEVPAQVREGEPFYVEVVINSNHEDEGLVEVFRGAHKVLSETRKLKAGENRFRFQQSITGERLAQYTVKVGGLKSDTLLDNNTESGLVFTTGKPRVLLIESDPKLAQQLVWALQQEEIEVDVRPVEGMPESLADLQNYELLALSNVPATSLSQRQMELARTYVQDLGGGFMMLGGDQSFGLGGYYKTVLEEILPVRSDFEKEKEKPSLGMVLVIDKSGSMGGDKMEMAKGGGEECGGTARSARPAWRDRVRRRFLRRQRVSIGVEQGSHHRRHQPHRSGWRDDDVSRDGGGVQHPPGINGQAEARHHADRRHQFAGRLRGDGSANGVGPHDLHDRRGGRRERHEPAGRDRSRRAGAVLLGDRPGDTASDFREGNDDREQVGDQRTTVRAAGDSTDSRTGRHRL